MLRSRLIPSVLWMLKQLTKFYLNITVTASNCVSISESDRDLIEGVENL